MNKAYRQFKEQMLRRYPMCDVCGQRPGKEINHCLYHKHGGIYDTPENCQIVCPECRETQKDNSRENREKHWTKRVSEGYEMVAYNQCVPEYMRVGYE